CMQPIQLPYTC
nr:immunoglobulin light chain junction region [Macaca mulatta]